MKLFIRKLFVVIVTIATFGAFVPQLPTELEKSVKADSDLTNQNERSIVSVDEIEELNRIEDVSWTMQALTIHDTESLVDSFTNHSVAQAEQLSMMKFGQTIGPVIEDEFKQIILPKIEEALYFLAQDLDEQDLRQLELTDIPASGHGEKIFHVYEKNSGQDFIRFHVRRDHPPQDGYWFNFHYHTYLDNFQKHHDLGSIYWDKNTPPNWMNERRH